MRQGKRGRNDERQTAELLVWLVVYIHTCDNVYAARVEAARKPVCRPRRPKVSAGYFVAAASALGSSSSINKPSDKYVSSSSLIIRANTHGTRRATTVQSRILGEGQLHPKNSFCSIELENYDGAGGPLNSDSRRVCAGIL